LTSSIPDQPSLNSQTCVGPRATLLFIETMLLESLCDLALGALLWPGLVSSGQLDYLQKQSLRSAQSLEVSDQLVLRLLLT
jgi:hypothetical protein